VLYYVSSIVRDDDEDRRVVCETKVLKVMVSSLPPFGSCKLEGHGCTGFEVTRGEVGDILGVEKSHGNITLV
jgi:hypothetical protein